MHKAENDIKSLKRDSANGFVNGVLILSLSTLICKVIGLFFKIPIINIVGIEGMAYFSAAYNIYMLLNSISAAGLPVALSILVSRNRTCGNLPNVKKTFNVSLSLFLIFGLAGTLILYFGSDIYSEIIGIEASSSAVKAIAPTLLFICISGAVRGYFQGHEYMLPTAISQLIESCGKLILGVGFALIAVRARLGDEYTASAAVLGLSAGVLISTVYLIIHKIRYNKKVSEHCGETSYATDKTKRILTELAVIALPITVSSCVTSLTSLADTALITNRLIYSGFSKDAAVTLYSSYTNLAIPLFNLPPALITAVAVSLVPALTASITRNNRTESDTVFSSSVKLSLAFALPAAAGMAVFAHPILDLIYPREPEACTFAAPLLSVLAAAIVFSCLTTVCNAVLQAYMKPVLPIISMAIGAVVKIIAEYVLIGTDMGIYGAPISTLACTFTILMIDALFVTIYTPHRFDFWSFLKTAVATAIGIGAAAVLYAFMIRTEISPSWALIVTIGCAVVFYALSALAFGVLRYSDVSHIPIGKKIGAILLKIKLIKE